MKPQRTNVASPRIAWCDRARTGHRAELIDIGVALDLLTVAVRQRREESAHRSTRLDGACHPAWRGVQHRALHRIADHVLALAGVESDPAPDAGIDTAYFGPGSRVPLTLGAWAILRAAQQSQDRGCEWDEVLAHAAATAIRVLDLVPESAFESAAQA
jgi:hypothetical protein